LQARSQDFAYKLQGISMGPMGPTLPFLRPSPRNFFLTCRLKWYTLVYFPTVRMYTYTPKFVFRSDGGGGIHPCPPLWLRHRLGQLGCKYKSKCKYRLPSTSRRSNSVVGYNGVYGRWYAYTAGLLRLNSLYRCG